MHLEVIRRRHSKHSLSFVQLRMTVLFFLKKLEETPEYFLWTHGKKVLCLLLHQKIVRFFPRKPVEIMLRFPQNYVEFE